MRIDIWTTGENTGGPWALAQLCQEMVSLGVDARLVNPREVYTDFDAQPLRLEHPGALPEVVVAPEVWGPQLLALQGVQRVLWWLSVDNAYKAGGDFFYDRLGTPERYAVLRKAFERRLTRLLQSREAGSLIHAVQSDYARRHVESRYGQATMLTDYLTDGLDAISDVAALSTDRAAKVLYYPTKGLRPMKRVIQACGTDVEFVPLQGLSRAELVAHLREAMVYVDLGSHPGRDRLPREAAACGCVVVVGRRGAGGNAIDLPIPERYKVETPSRTVSAEPVSRLLRQILGSFEEHQAAMAGFREIIRGQRSLFNAEVGALATALASPDQPCDIQAQGGRSQGRATR